MSEDEKVVLITGATSGLGRAAAAQLASLGYRVVLHGRSRSKLDATKASIVEATGNERVHRLQADLSAQADIREAAQEFHERFDRLDILINNAGVVHANRKLTIDGIEEVFAVNHLAYFLLTHLLLDTLMASAPARIVVVSSDAHRSTSMNWEDLMFENRWPTTGFPVYAQSKLANLLFVNELARRVQGTGVTTNAVHPGFVGSNFGKNTGWLAKAIMFFTQPLQKSPARAAETLVWAATEPSLDAHNGCYIADKKITRPTAEATNADDASRLWQVSADLCGLTVPS